MGAAMLASLPMLTRAQNSTEETVIQVLYITDENLGLALLSDQELEGSVLEADESSTVVAFGCVGASATELCGTIPVTVTYGPRTFVASEVTGNLEATLSCSIAESTQSADCTAGFVLPVAFFQDPLMPTSELLDLITATGQDLSTTAFSATLSSTAFTDLPVTITAGQQILASASASASAKSVSGNSATTLKLSMMCNGLLAGALSVIMILL